MILRWSPSQKAAAAAETIAPFSAAVRFECCFTDIKYKAGGSIRESVALSEGGFAAFEPLNTTDRQSQQHDE